MYTHMFTIYIYIYTHTHTYDNSNDNSYHYLHAHGSRGGGHVLPPLRRVAPGPADLSLSSIIVVIML